MKRLMCFFAAVIVMVQAMPVFAENKIEDIDAKAVILTEQSTGEVLYEENPDERLPIASVTKIMTLLLIMEKIDDGSLSPDDKVTVSENAMSYGGSTMFLETGEQLSVNDMLKGIAVASANDGCVAMAEYIAGSESAFVDMMNEKAHELGMENTHFMNTNGLDEEEHYSSARDVAIMSRELISHPKIFDYTTIWTDQLRDGKFQLANTNKLIRFYPGANGLKTGSTSKALCCLSACAIRDDMQLIAVVLGAPTSAKRFSGAKALLDYGFANYGIKLFREAGEEITETQISKGVSDNVKLVCGEEFRYLTKKNKGNNFEEMAEVSEDITAPVEQGQKLGTLTFTDNGEVIGTVDLVARDTVEKKGIGRILSDFFAKLISG